QHAVDAETQDLPEKALPPQALPAAPERLAPRLAPIPPSTVVGPGFAAFTRANPRRARPRRDALVTELRSGCSPSLGRGVRLRSDQPFGFVGIRICRVAWRVAGWGWGFSFSFAVTVDSDRAWLAHPKVPARIDQNLGQSLAPARYSPAGGYSPHEMSGSFPS